MQTFGERLRWAIEEHGPRPPRRPSAPGSIRQFHERIRGRVPSGQGATYAMLHRYLKGDTIPPAEFLDAAVDELSPVRREWLKTGDGERTESEQQVVAAAPARQDQSAEEIEVALRAFAEEHNARVELRKKVDAILCSTALTASTDPSSPLVRLAATWALRGGMTVSPEDIYTAVAEALVAPLTSLGLDPAELDPDAYEHHLTIAAENLRVLVARRTSGSSDATSA